MRTICATGALLAALAVAGTGAATGPRAGQKDDGRPFVKTFTVATQDDGSCGRAWANAVVKRTYEVKPNRNGTYTLTRRDHGTFTTLRAASPGSCDPTGRHGRAIRAGVRGLVDGQMRGVVSGGVLDRDAVCGGTTCGFTDAFLQTFFGADATFSCFGNAADCTFNFEYTAARGQRLKYRHWQDRGKGAGTKLRETFEGDIADA